MNAPFTYLDWAATAPLCPEARTAMCDALGSDDCMAPTEANPNSLHTPGRRAFAALEDARARISRIVGANRPPEITFTSGATEADNTAILGIISARIRAERQAGNSDYRPHFITSAIEHDAVLSVIDPLREHGCSVSVLKPNRAGFLDPQAISDAIRPETALVSIMAANNEMGAVQDIPALCSAAHDAQVPFHTDATQALGKVPLSMAEWKVDAASFSGHKVGGPKGIGALYLRHGCACDALLRGGGQEGGQRSGTQNVLGAVGFARACEVAAESPDDFRTRLTSLRDLLYQRLCTHPSVTPSVPCGPGDKRYLPNIVNVLVAGFESETLILQLDLEGFCVSGGSACSSGSLEPSHVLSALGISRDAALGSLRISMGPLTSKDDILRFIEAFESIVSR